MIAELFRYNASTLFILKPVVGVNFGVLEEEFGMINSYLRDKAREDLEGNLLFVLFKPIDFDYFELFLQDQIDKNENFIEDYDHIGGHVVIAYRIPENMKEDFELFKQGKYSKLSDLIKNSYDKQIRAFLKPMPSFQWDVFEKSRKLKKELEEFFDTKFEQGMELWGLPDMEKETLNIQQFIKPERNEEVSVANSNE